METYWFVYVTIFLVALVQVPIAIDLLRFFFPHWKISRIASRLVHIVLFICMGLIFCIGISYHIFVYLPIIVIDPLHSVKGWLHLTFAVWLWINMIGNYYYVVTVHPGIDTSYKPRKKESASKKNDPLCAEVESETTNSLRNRSENEATKNGRRDVNNKKPTNGLEWHPKETHYCKICECAIPHIDHHCPFTGCCAGLDNYSYFFVGLCYGAVGLFYAVVITLPYFFDCNLKNILWFFRLVQDRTLNAQCAELGPHTHIFIPVFAGFVVITHILCLQFIFLLADLSTYNVLTYWSDYPMAKFMWQRMRAGKFLEQNSRLKVLILNQRPSILWFLLPVGNSSPKHTLKKR